jgi:hypothetical protein
MTTTMEREQTGTETMRRHRLHLPHPHLPHPHVPAWMDPLSVRFDDLDLEVGEQEMIDELEYYGPR